ncbi:hypothetical protein [Synechococcus sp. EJ6-Ellesmere]|uniref:hypothetical protein n=1 Tax=Synechococcus sp. EJ6-Ellesmere TaxID=2823734 RepID=UPI0020CF872B|nr:hypothetical protein [Synechococcus sp. EJ6-Ellesmere]MCP9823905.1 hypothetical protein [Synechococcus sp. EJ6-Ellesmere]
MEGSMATGGLNATVTVSFRVPPAYAQLVEQLAIKLDISTALFVRRAVEHFAQNVVADEVGPDLPDQLVSLGKTIRSHPRPIGRRAGRPLTTAA